MRSGIMGEKDNMVTMHDILDAQVRPLRCMQAHAPALLSVLPLPRRLQATGTCLRWQHGQRCVPHPTQHTATYVTHPPTHHYMPPPPLAHPHPYVCAFSGLVTT